LLNRVVVLAPADRTDGHQGTVLLLVQLAALQVGLRLGEVAQGLVEVGLILARIELVEELARLHGRSLAIRLGEEVTLDLGPDLRVDGAVGGPDPFRARRDVLLHRLGDLDLRRLLHRRSRLAAGRDSERAGYRECPEAQRAGARARRGSALGRRARA